MYVSMWFVGSTYHSPVDLEVGKENVVECREHGQHVGIFMQLAQILAVLIQCPGFVPTSGHSWVILPLVKQGKMLGVCIIESNHGKMLLEVGNPPAVDDRTRLRFRFSDRVHCMAR